ncbi:alpha-hydroxy acid oxidase [Chelatococcus asaccharovorans]|uniref:L-lactate dehydrogenase (Cytochrome)/4-hydroxymandelate oxidase n=1 Tax=Chelatococcus asaccharovorans TaxID=28210 RepID=A0A2V3TZY1_9HYPH|nr:alpha-hydroxy acid oxidase [Chelatococcus asaccharovorans]MBS7707733.1 alpha-hydroxy-acid oxidizing protein [Chelatococcus asaccharovorans]PXW55310.1 L-lactate dehydrogenase (cytochrome)/4-hydroxymandelate oxidase [Chelatococcus asaccharovorans]
MKAARARAELVSVDDYSKAAHRVLPRMIDDFVRGGALDERTLARNAAGFDDLWLRARSFSAASQVELGTTVLGSPITLPVMTAPTGASGLLWPGGEAATGRATAACGTIMQVSAGSLQSMEDIAAGSQGPKWLQLFLYKDRGLTTEFLQRAKAAGYRAIMVTTDCPVHGRRERDSRNGFTMERRIRFSRLVDTALRYRWWLRMAGAPQFSLRNFEGRATGGLVDMAAYIASVLDPDVTWADLDWLRGQWDGPLVIKGILHPDDARQAVAAGVDGIQVSNHGGRQLDGTLATIDALPAVVDAVAGKVPVLLDGGVRRGTDVIKALALGAAACAIGRSHLWGLAVAGERGVAAVLDILAAEMRNAMMIGGWRSVADLRRVSVCQLRRPDFQRELMNA